MKKQLIAMLTMSALLLVGCGGDSTSEPAEDTTQQIEETTQQATDTLKEKTDENIQEYNQIVVDDDIIKIELLNIESKYDEFLDENQVLVNFEVENKTDRKIDFQASGISIGDYMVDEAVYYMSQEINPQKKAKAVLTFTDMGGEERPDFVGAFEGTLHVVDFQDFSFNQEYPFSIDLESGKVSSIDENTEEETTQQSKKAKENKEYAKEKYTNEEMEANAKKFPADSVGLLYGERFKNMGYNYIGKVEVITDFENPDPNMDAKVLLAVNEKDHGLLITPPWPITVKKGDEIEVYGFLTGESYNISHLKSSAWNDEVGMIEAFMVYVNGEPVFE